MFLNIDANLIEEKITSKTKAILICNPGNPTGYLYSKEELNKLKDIVKKHDLYLFADEVYREFCYDGKEHHSLLNLEGIKENVIVADSPSINVKLVWFAVTTGFTERASVVSFSISLQEVKNKETNIEAKKALFIIFFFVNHEIIVLTAEIKYSNSVKFLLL